MTYKQIEVYAPASIANLGPGFDVFGIALDNMGDILRLEISSDREISVSMRGLDVGSIPLDARANSAGAVLRQALELTEVDHGFRVEIEKGVPQGKGLGSSGASAAAAAYAANELLELGLSRKELIALAAVGEAAVAGSAHADNVSASLLGGFIMVGADFDAISLEPPCIEMVIAAPKIHYENKTRLARSLLPKQVELKDVVRNVGNASRMAAAVALKDPVLFGRSICDCLIEPRRAEMIPNFWKVKEEALKAGAYGCSIAGGGPSVFAVGKDSAPIGDAMAKAFSEAGVESDVYFTRPSPTGVRVI